MDSESSCDIPWLKESQKVYFVSQTKDSYRNERNTPPLIFENLKPVEIIKKSFEQHLNILKNV
jgi:hypothetical protein